MANPYVNKVVVGGVTKIDLTSDTVTADKLLSTYTAHDKSGAPITGSCTYDSDTQDATAAVGEILLTKTAYARGAKLTGTMPNNGSVTLTISDKGDEPTIAQGYHDGSGKAVIAAAEKAKIIGSNIKSGVQLLGVTGTYTGEAISAQARTATPTFAVQTITPESGYDYLSQVTVNAIPVTETDNSAGGKTLTVG